MSMQAYIQFTNQVVLKKANLANLSRQICVNMFKRKKNKLGELGFDDFKACVKKMASLHFQQAVSDEIYQNFIENILELGNSLSKVNEMYGINIEPVTTKPGKQKSLGRLKHVQSVIKNQSRANFSRQKHNFTSLTDQV